MAALDGGGFNSLEKSSSELPFSQTGMITKIT